MHSSSQKFLSFSGFIQRELSQSIKTGSANWYLTGFTAAINVSAGTITISPGCMPPSINDKCMPAVPLWHTATSLIPRKLASCFSNFSTYAPPVETHPCITASSTYFFSFPSKLGTDSGINLSIFSSPLFLYKYSYILESSDFPFSIWSKLGISLPVITPSELNLSISTVS